MTLPFDRSLAPIKDFRVQSPPSLRLLNSHSGKGSLVELRTLSAWGYVLRVSFHM